MAIPFMQDEPTKAKKCPLMAHSGLTLSVEDSTFEDLPKKFKSDYIDKVSMLAPLWQQQTIDDMKRRAQRECQEAPVYWLTEQTVKCSKFTNN